MSTTQSEKSDGTTNRTIRNIRKAINDQFNKRNQNLHGEHIFVITNETQTQKTESDPNIKQVDQINRDTSSNTFSANETTEKKSLGVNAAPFLFRTASMVCYTKDDKQPQDEDTIDCSETQSVFHQLINIQCQDYQF